MGISDIVVISVDRTEETWHVEGEAIFEGDFSTPFAVTFCPIEEEVDALEFVMPPKDFDFDRGMFIEMLVAAIFDFDE